MGNVATKAMEEKIASLEVQVSRLQAELETNRKATLAAMLGPLRLHGIILTYIGVDNTADLVKSLSEKFSAWEVNQAIRHLFVLNHAPCTDEQRETVRSVFQDGTCKF